MLLYCHSAGTRSLWIGRWYSGVAEALSEKSDRLVYTDNLYNYFFKETASLVSLTVRCYRIVGFIRMRFNTGVLCGINCIVSKF